MAVCYPIPRFICIKCGGQIPPKNINEPTDHHPNCRCINCIMIGPGRRPIYVPDKEKHICQKLIDKKAIVAERRRLRLVAGPLVKAFIKKFSKKRKKQR